MKSIISSILICFALTTQAFAGSAGDLKQAFDEFNYAVTVEWDQSDSSFYDQQMKHLESNIVKLQEQGLSNQELIDFGTSQIKNSHLKSEVMHIFGLIESEKLSEAETITMLQSVQEASYDNGASWNGSATIVAASVIIVIGVAIAARVYKSKANVKNNRTE